MDNALKAISRTDDELRVGNYIVLFGDANTRDLEGIATPRQNPDGSIGEYFTAETVLESTATKAGRMPVSWEHYLKQEGPKHTPGVLGYVDWSTSKADGMGVWVQRVLDRSNAYVRWIEYLIDAGKISTSSEPDPRGVEKASDGRIVRWPINGDGLTVAPMEWRMMTGNVLQAAKALGLFADQPEPEDKPGAAVSGGESVKATTEGIDSTTEEDDMTEEVTNVTMTPDELAALVKGAVSDGVEAWRAAQPAPGAGVLVQEENKLDTQHDNREDKPFASVGEFLKAIASTPSDPRLRPVKSTDPADEGGFNFTAVAGHDRIGSLTAAKAISGLSEQVPADGGVLVGTDRGQTLMERVYNTGDLLRRVAMMPISGNSNGMSLPGVDETSRADGSRLGGVQAYWAAEADEKTKSKPKFRTVDLKLNKVIGLVYATDELLQDDAALESWIMARLPDELRFKVEDAIINGTGVGMPQGILACNALVQVGKETGQLADTIVAENVSKAWARRWGASGRNYIWLHNQDIEPQLDQLSFGVGTGGSLVYIQPGGLSDLPYGRFKGRPTIPTEYNPTLGDLGDLLLVDPTQYQMIEKGGIQSASSIHVRFIYDEQVFRFVYRIDGRPLWHSALTPFKGNDTQSPFVAIAERA